MRIPISLTFVFVIALSEGAAMAEDPYSLQWGRQFGTSQDDTGSSVTTDGLGNVYVGGHATGNLNGQISSGGRDGFVSKYDASGTVLWTRLVGSTLLENATDVVSDSAGNVYVGGETQGNLGGPNSGSFDSFIRKLDSNGNTLWTRQFGTSSSDRAKALALDSDANVYVTGESDGNLDGQINSGGGDAFLRKLDSNGNLLWSRLLGTPVGDSAWDVIVEHNSGSVYVTGTTGGNLGGQTNNADFSAFLTKYDSAGIMQWTRLVAGSLGAAGEALVADGAGHVFLAGRATGTIDEEISSGQDMLIARFGSDGARDWARLIGTIGQEFSGGIAFDGTTGTLFVVGTTDSGSTSDVLFSKWDTTGSLIWSQQLGSSQRDAGRDITIDALGAAYLTGSTNGAWYGPYVGINGDAFVAKFTPEPASVALLLVTWVAIKRRRRT